MESSSTNNFNPVHENPQTLFMWKAPLRPYKKRSKNIIRFYVALALLLSLIIVFFGDKILLVPIWTLLFLFYVYTVTPPPEIENRITKFGLETAGMTMRWDFLSHFYFMKRFGYDMLTIVGHEPYNQHVYLVVTNDEVKGKIMEILSQHLIYIDKPTRTMTDKLVDSLMKLLPDDEDTINTPASLSRTPVPATP